jgi:hypothetical protein
MRDFEVYQVAIDAVEVRFGDEAILKPQRHS